MKIQKIGIIGGTGGIGAAFVEFFGQKFPDKKVLVSGRKTKITNQKVVQTCDLVIFSVPISCTESAISEVLEVSRPNQIWADFTSVKVFPMQAMHRSRAEVCGLHPLFGPMKSGISGHKIVVCPGKISENSLTALKNLFADFEILQTSPESHDSAMGIVQGVSHFSDLLVGEMMRQSDSQVAEIQAFSSAPYALKFSVLGRMFAQNPQLYAQILVQNRDAISECASVFRELADLISAEKTSELVHKFQKISDFLGENFCRDSAEKTEKMIAFLAAENRAEFQKPPEKEAIESRQKSIDLAIFGEKFSHTDEGSFLFSARKNSARIAYFKTIFEVFESVGSGRAKCAVVPFENSRGGAVIQTLDGLFDRQSVRICAMREKSIRQFLVGLKGAKISDINLVFSHPQAIEQSRRFLNESLPNADILVEKSTVAAAEKVRANAENSTAAIASESAAEALGLEILAGPISPRKNRTKFVLISKKSNKKFVQKNPKNTSLAFWFSGDKSGNLAAALGFFAAKKVNLNRLDSRRAGAKFGHYLFFVDAEISPQKFEKIRPQFQKICGGIRILGAF